MKKSFSAKWKASKQPRKQRKYRHMAPLHIKQRFMAAHLSGELRKKHGRRAAPVRKGDEVKIMRGQFKGKKGKIERISLKNQAVFISKIELIKKDGTKTTYPINPSNLMITALSEDKRRFKKAELKLKPKPETKAVSKPEQASKSQPEQKRQHSLKHGGKDG